MKKINSISYGPAILACGLILALPGPILIYLLQKPSGQKHYLRILAKVSSGTGVLILVFLTVLLIIELKQDKRINEFYQNNKNTKIRLSNGFYECQNCGNKRIREGEEVCPVCGINLYHTSSGK